MIKRRKDMIDYEGNCVDVEGCMSCAFSKHKFSIPAGIAYEDDLFVLAQDWALPIQGFFVISPKRHVKCLSELSDFERNKMFEIINRAIVILKENNVCNCYSVIFEEKDKPNHHLHVWIMPRHKWMLDLVGNIVDNIGEVCDYAKENFRTKENFDKIKEATQILKSNLQKA